MRATFFPRWRGPPRPRPSPRPSPSSRRGPAPISHGGAVSD
ncbi:hypothetical protein, partial [Tsukamurella strandjordii]